MKLIVGLGTPGRKYENTRHNIGFEVIHELARRFHADPARDRFSGRQSEANFQGERVLLLCPETYMNLSGRSVGEAMSFYKLPLEDLLVVCDDFNLPLGRIRLRPKGSAGGQKGLNDIIKRMGSSEIPRLRLGIGPPPEKWDVADFVLSRFTKSEAETVQDSIRRAADAAEVWQKLGIQESMNQYNSSVGP